MINICSTCFLKEKRSSRTEMSLSANDFYIHSNNLAERSKQFSFLIYFTSLILKKIHGSLLDHLAVYPSVLLCIPPLIFIGRLIDHFVLCVCQCIRVLPLIFAFHTWESTRLVLHRISPLVFWSPVRFSILIWSIIFSRLNRE